jgi:predicted membrane protein
MNENKFETETERRWGAHKSRNGNVWTGLFLLLIGALLLARTSGVIFPFWFFTWPMFLIAMALFIGIRHGFRVGGWMVMLIVGGVFLAEKVTASSNLRPYLWPILLIAAGLFIMLKPKSRHGRNVDLEVPKIVQKDICLLIIRKNN